MFNRGAPLEVIGYRIHNTRQYRRGEGTCLITVAKNDRSWESRGTQSDCHPVRWQIIDLRVLEPLEDIDMQGADALHVNVLVDDLTIGRVIVPCRSRTCSASRLRAHLDRFVAPALTHSLRDRIDPHEHRVDPEVSVVVCTRNRAEQLDRCLASLSALVGVRAEIIVVDNGDDGGRTVEVARRHDTRYLVEPVAGLDRARNRGVATASHDLVLFTDDDVEVDPMWAQHLADAFDDPIVAAATGLVMPAELETREQIDFETLAGFVRTFDDFVLDGAVMSPPSAGRAGAGASMAFRTDFLREIGGFPDVLDCGRPTSSGGDTYALYRAMRDGHRIRFEPRAVVRHHHRASAGAGAATVEAYARGVVSYLLYAGIHDRDASALVAAGKWTGWRLGLLAREWIFDPRSRSTQYVRRQVRGALTAPPALVRALRENPAPPIVQPRPAQNTSGEPSRVHEGTRVSVVIPTHGRRPAITQLLSHLHRQTCPVEIIVSADGDYSCRDDVEAAIGSRLDARVVTGASGGAGDARNRGAAAAIGDIILFLDDDVIPLDDDLVARHAAAHRHGHRVAVGPVIGSIAPGSSAALSFGERNWWSDQARRIGSGDALDFTDVCSGNLSIDRRLFNEIGGFGTMVRREDFELGIRLIERGHEVVGLGDASVWHVEMCTLDGARQRRHNEGRADCLLATEHPTSMFRLGLGSWNDLSRRSRRLARLAIEHPRPTMTALNAFQPVSTILDRLGSRRRLDRIHTLVGHLAYWSGVGAQIGGFDAWRRLHAQIEHAVDDAPRSVLAIDQPSDWTPPHSGSHLINVLVNDHQVGVANMRWGGIPFDRDRFAQTCATEFAVEGKAVSPQHA